MTKGLRYTLIGTATFIICLVLFAPTTPISSALQGIPGVFVGQPSGSLWRGAVDVAYHGNNLGRLSWSYRPQELLRLRIGFGYSLKDATHSFVGVGSASARSANATISGQMSAALLTDLLARYDISISGDFDIPEAIDLVAPHGGMPRATGKIRWSGGTVAYRLGTTSRRATLPQLIAYLESPATGPSATVYAQGDDTPLLLASVQRDGWVSIGVTVRFLELVGQPWTGSQPPHAVIMEVQEKLF